MAPPDPPPRSLGWEHSSPACIIRPPWSSIVAYDLNTGTIKLQRPVGLDLHAAAEGGEDTGVPEAQRNGMIVISSGLIFSTAKDGKIYAFDADDGEVLWSGDLPTGTEGLPAFYEVGGARTSSSPPRQPSSLGEKGMMAAPRERGALEPALRVRGPVVFGRREKRDHKGGVAHHQHPDGPAYNLAAPDDEERRESIALVKEWVDVSRTLGAPSIRANTGNGKLEDSVASLREINDYAAERGILLLTENHGGISTDPDVLLQVLQAIPGDNFRAVADFGNFPEGTDRHEASARLIPHTHVISAKPQVFDAEGNHTSFDFDRCVQTAESAGFRGVYSAEQWDPSTDPLDAEYIADWMIEHMRANV